MAYEPLPAVPEEEDAQAKEAKAKKARLRAMFAVNEIPSFHTVRPPQGLVVQHEPKDSRTATASGILKPPTFSASPTKHPLQPKAAGKQIRFLPPEQNSLAIVPRVEEERNEELWWTMEDLDRSSAEADQGTFQCGGGDVWSAD